MIVFVAATRGSQGRLLLGEKNILQSSLWCFVKYDYVNNSFCFVHVPFAPRLGGIERQETKGWRLCWPFKEVIRYLCSKSFLVTRWNHFPVLSFSSCFLSVTLFFTLGLFNCHYIVYLIVTILFINVVVVLFLALFLFLLLFYWHWTEKTFIWKTLCVWKCWIIIWEGFNAKLIWKINCVFGNNMENWENLMEHYCRLKDWN